MVKRIFSILNKEITGLHQAAYLLAFATILSQGLAIVRDKLLAYMFGASHTLDLYYAAFRIPDMIFVTIASMVSASVLVPFFIKKFKDNDDGKNSNGKHFVDHTFSAFFLAIIIASIAAFFLIPYLIPHLLPGFSDDANLHELIVATRILLLSPILLGISNFLASVTQMYNRFLIYAISPLLYNLGIIVGTVVFYPIFGLYGLVGGVVLGALLHMLLQVPFVSAKGLVPRFRFPIDWNAIREVVLVSIPRTLTLSSNQIATFFLVALATLMGEGAVSVFAFSWNLQSVPLAIIGVSYSSAAFPSLAKLFESKEISKYVDYMATSARHIIFWSIPITIMFLVLRAQIVRVILGAGKFDWSDTRLTAAMFGIFTLSVVGQSLILLFVRAYYAEGKTSKPLLINVISAASIVVLGYALTKFFHDFPTTALFIEALFKVDHIENAIVLVLPIAYSLGVLLNTFLHWWIFHKDYPEFSKSVWQTLWHSTGAAIIMGYVAFKSLYFWSMLLDLSTVHGIFFQGFFAGITGTIAWVIVLLVMKNPEIHEVSKVLHSKIFKTKMTPTDTLVG